MNETLDLPLFDLCDGRPSASQRLGGAMWTLGIGPWIASPTPVG